MNYYDITQTSSLCFQTTHVPKLISDTNNKLMSPFRVQPVAGQS